MSYIGKVENGVVVLPPEANLANGTAVKVEPLAAPRTTRTRGKGESFLKRYREFVGIANDLPADLAENHDHYLYGTPKKGK